MPQSRHRVQVDFGRYKDLRVSRSPYSVQVEPKRCSGTDHANLTNHAAAIWFRDGLIASRLTGWGVRSVIDIGSDFGSLLAACESEGMEALGIDADESAVELCRSAGLRCVEGRIEDIATVGLRESLGRDWTHFKRPLAISCLNILHGFWPEPRTRERFMSEIFEVADVVVWTSFKSELRRDLRRVGLQRAAIDTLLPFPLQTRMGATFSQYQRTFLTRGRVFESIESGVWRLLKPVTRTSYTNKFEAYARLVCLAKVDSA